MTPINKKTAVLAAAVLVLLSLSSGASGAPIGSGDNDDDDAGLQQCCQKFAKFMVDHPEIRDQIGPYGAPADPDEAWFVNFCTENAPERPTQEMGCEYNLSQLEIIAKEKEEKGLPAGQQ
jgi:hypothetical protein